MQLEPHSFEAHVNHMGLKVYGLIVSNEELPDLKTLFTEDFKTLNASDPNFYHTCVCVKGQTEWRFSYSTTENQQKARKLIRSQFTQIRGILLNPSVTNSIGNEACQCPFLGK